MSARSIRSILGLAIVCLVGAASTARVGAQQLEPGLNIDGRRPGFEAEVNRCLTELSWLGDVSARVVADVRAAEYFVVITPATIGAVRNDTRPVYQADGTFLGANIFWNPADVRAYRDGATRMPCGTLLHELQHAADMVNGSLGRPIEDPRDRKPNVGPGEYRAVHAENWYLWMHRASQRRWYDYTRLPDTVIWGTGIPGDPRALTMPPPVEPPQTPPPPVPPVPPPTERSQEKPGTVTLTVVNDTPNLILIAGRTRGDEEMSCGGDNPYFRARSADRRCLLRIQTALDRNPFAVPLITLVAYFPSGDPAFPRNGRVVWTDDRGGPLDCGGNAYSEYCQIRMGTPGDTESGRRTRATPSSRTVHVRYQAGRSGVASASRRPGGAVSQ
jgi:hypothetical protein